MKRILLLAFGAVSLAAPVLAQVTLTDGNAVAILDPTSAASIDRRGLNSWRTDGQEELYQQWYWYRIGNTAEATIDTISAPTVTPMGTNGVNVRYQNNSIRMDLTFMLIGGAPNSGTSDVSEIMRITNITGAPLDFHLFEYDDFDLGTSFSDDRAELTNSSTIRQFDATTTAMVGTVPLPSRWQIAQSGVIYNDLINGTPTNLTNSGSPFGPGDATFAFQWDVTIGAGDSFVMSKNKLIDIVPEPASFIAVGAMGLLALLRRRK